MSDGWFIRPVEPHDLDDLVTLARALGSGVTTLPPDRDALGARIQESVNSFARRVTKPGGEWYLFVLIDPAGRVRGTSGLLGRLGGFDPDYAYEIRTEVHDHPPLGVHHELEVLHLRRLHKGPSELASLALDPAVRGGGLGRLLSRARFLFVASHPERFAELIMAEIRGYSDSEGRSPFWECVGRHFFAKEYAEVDFLTGLGNKEFIEDLMPRHPIYLTLLPAAARETVGRPHPQSEPALRLLEREGLRRSGEIDIFDAGPIVAGRIAELPIVREHRRLRVRALLDHPPDGERHLVANGRLAFRAVSAHLRISEPDSVSLSRAAADALEVGLGDAIRVADG